jgi:hypothetical protein
MTERLRSKRPLLQSSRQMIPRKLRRFLLSPLAQGSSAIVASKTVGPDLVGQKSQPLTSFGYETLPLAWVRGFLS